MRHSCVCHNGRVDLVKVDRERTKSWRAKLSQSHFSFQSRGARQLASTKQLKKFEAKALVELSNPLGGLQTCIVARSGTNNN